MCLRWRRIIVPYKDTRSPLFKPDLQYKPTPTGGTHPIRNPWFLLSRVTQWSCYKCYQICFCAFSECNCHDKAEECHFNQTVADLSLSLDIHGQRRGGGVCVGCRDYTAGINCETCIPGFYRPAGVEIILLSCPMSQVYACNNPFYLARWALMKTTPASHAHVTCVVLPASHASQTQIRQHLVGNPIFHFLCFEYFLSLEVTHISDSKSSRAYLYFFFSTQHTHTLHKHLITLVLFDFLSDEVAEDHFHPHLLLYLKVFLKTTISIADNFTPQSVFILKKEIY